MIYLWKGLSVSLGEPEQKWNSGLVDCRDGGGVEHSLSGVVHKVLAVVGEVEHCAGGALLFNYSGYSNKQRVQGNNGVVVGIYYCLFMLGRECLNLIGKIIGKIPSVALRVFVVGAIYVQQYEEILLRGIIALLFNYLERIYVIASSSRFFPHRAEEICLCRKVVH